MEDLLTAFTYGYVADEREDIVNFLENRGLCWCDDACICFLPEEGGIIPLNEAFQKRLNEIEDTFGDIFEEAHEYLGWYYPVHWTWKGKIIRQFFKGSVKVNKEWTQEKILKWLEDLYDKVSLEIIQDILG